MSPMVLPVGMPHVPFSVGPETDGTGSTSDVSAGESRTLRED